MFGVNMYSTPQPQPSPWSATGPVNNAYIPVTTARRSLRSASMYAPPSTYSSTPTPLLQPPAGLTASSFNLTTQQIPPAPAPVKKKVDWSPAIRQYVQRSFAPESLIDGISRAEMEMRLKRIITDAAESNSLEAINWATHPLPQQMIQQERNRTILAPVQPAPWDSQPPVVAQHQQVAMPQEFLRKRKSSELSTDLDRAPENPPWRKSAISNAFEDRVSFAPSPDKRPRIETPGKPTSKSIASLETRKKRFEDARSGLHSPQTGNSSRGDSPSTNGDTGPVIGRSQKLEKHYFRLTSAPNPDDVRPIEVLKKTLELLKKKWRSDNNYTYICDQFKSLRQDLTVQHIKNDFTVNVYELHARIALEKGDLGEYNQCQTQLRALYKQNLGGHPVEFKAYRILYFIHTCNRTDMTNVLSDLTIADKLEKPIKHALNVRSALALGNYHQFFKLYLTVPNMGAYLMDMFIARERLAALSSICRVYKPDVKIRFITEELAFESDEEAARFILEYAPEELLEQRDGQVRLLTGKAGLTFETAKAAAFRSVDIKGQI